ncbi:MAG: alpha/beta hydrolase [Candidatus Aminicenantes bacterium]|nr:alpha/beta hydrolase [Candidatus Aminicenantes bacterium]
MNVTVNGAELFYTTRGRGPTILIPGGMGTRPNELLMPAQMSDRFRLVFVDLRGSGQSTGQAADLTFDILAEDLEAVRTDLGVDRVAVLGHSILGILAIEYGKRCPAAVSHVIAVGTPPFGDMARLASLASAFFKADASEDRQRILRENMARLTPSSSPGQALLAQTPTRFFDPRFDAAPLFAGASRNPAQLMHVMRTLTPAWDILVDAGRLQVPLLITQGRFDYTVPHTLWEGVVDKLPGATFRIFEQSGHQPFFEEPGLFAEALADWMAGSGPLTGPFSNC